MCVAASRQAAVSSSVTPSCAAPVGVADRRVGGGEQVPLRHQVGVDVVVLDRGVLVGAGDPVDVELARAGRGGPASATAGPSPPAARSPTSRSNSLVAGRLHVARAPRRRCRRRCGTRRCRPASTPSTPGRDRAPREGRAGEAERAGPLPGRVEGGVPPAQRVGHRRGLGVGQHRQHEHLGVPERVPVVARARSGPWPAIGRRSARAPACSTWNSPNRTACCTSGSPSTSHVGGRPRTRPGTPAARASSPSQPVKRRGGQRGVDLVAQRRQRAPAGPAVGEELDHRSFSPGLSTHATVVRAQSSCASVVTSCAPGPSTSWSIAAATRSPLTLVRCISRPPASPCAAAPRPAAGGSSTAATRGSALRPAAPRWRPARTAGRRGRRRPPPPPRSGSRRPSAG